MNQGIQTNKKALTALGVVVLLVGLTTLLLGRVEQNYRLGEPGLKLQEEPLYDEEGEQVRTNRVDLPKRVAGHDSRLLPITRDELDWLPDDTTFGRRLYRGPGGSELMVSVVLMGTDRTSIHKPEYCLTGQGFNIEGSPERESIAIEEPAPYELPVTKMTTSKRYQTASGEEATVSGVFVYWFVSEDRLTASHWSRMGWMAKDLVTKGKLNRWAYIAIFSTCRPGEEEATFEEMKEFIAAAVPKFQLTVPRHEGGESAPAAFSLENGDSASHSPGQF